MQLCFEEMRHIFEYDQPELQSDEVPPPIHSETDGFDCEKGHEANGFHFEVEHGLTDLPECEKER